MDFGKIIYVRLLKYLDNGLKLKKKESCLFNLLNRLTMNNWINGNNKKKKTMGNTSANCLPVL